MLMARAIKRADHGKRWIRSPEPARPTYTGATQLPFWSASDRLRETRPSNPHQRWTAGRELYL